MRQTRLRPLETRWIAASHASLPPRNDNVYGYLTPLCLSLVIARAESPWRSTVNQQAKRQAVRVLSRHDGLPRRPFCPPRNDKV